MSLLSNKLKKYGMYFLTLSVGLFSNPFSFAEGTKQLTPAIGDDNKGVLQVFDNNDINRNSLSYAAPEERQMKIEICNPGEVIYFGMNYDAGDVGACNSVWYRIKSPSGIIIFGPQQITNTGPGSIANHAQAVAGPNALIGGAGGYTALMVDPIMALIGLGQAPELGSYVIEVNRNNANTFVNTTNNCTGSRVKTRLRFFDVTVADAPGGNRIDGRLWSKSWDLQCNGATNAFNCRMFVYADDGIVTALNFNGIRPHGFTISCNRTGVANSGNAFNDRQSINGNFTPINPYRIFLNDPDPNCFPSGIFGAVTGPVTVSGCDQNNRCINITVDKAGQSQLILNFNGVAGYQPNTADVLIAYNLSVGTNCIPWNGRDGLGNLVPTGITLDMQLDYFNGLTNLPLFDVENHPGGYIVTIARPTVDGNGNPIPVPLLFWDDSKIAGGTTNLTGCASSLPTNGCHRWSGNTAPDGVTARTDWGDNRTINTWWYANYIKVSATYNVPGSISVDADNTSATNTASICTNTPSFTLNGSVTGSTATGTWTSSSGNAAGFSNATQVNGSTYTPSATDKTNGSVKLFLTSTNNGACPAVRDSITLTFTPGPTVNAGGPVTRCANNAVVANLGGSFGGSATGATWTGGTTAGFTPNRNTATAQYTPTAAEISSGSLVLTLTTTGGACPAISATKTITFTTPPAVTMGPDVTVCANNAAATVTATSSNASSVLWTGGAAGSSFANATTNSATYTPAPSELSAAPTTVTLTYTASQAGCTSVSGTLNVSITPTPIMNAGPNRTICSNDSINLVGTRTNAPSSTWSSPTATAASFKPNATNLSTNYKPTAADIANGSVVISLTSGGNNCTPVVSTMTLTITPAPTISAGADKIVCSNNPTTSLTATTSAAGVQWYAGAGSYSASNTSNPLTYTLNAAEVASASTGLIVRTTGGTCPPVTDTVFIFVTPAPTVNAGPDLPSCANNTTVQVTGATTSATSMTWTTLNGGAFNNTGITNPFFTPSATDVSAGTATIILTANQAGCLPVRDTALVNIAPTPIVSAGPNRSVCSNNATVTFTGTVTNATGLIWSTAGDGRFSPGATTTATGLTPTYVPGPNDISSGGPIIITARSTGHGARCTQVSSNTQLTIYAAPTVNAGTAGPVCANNATSIALSGTATNATTTTWSGGGGGTFSAANNLSTTYTTLPAERVTGNINFTLTATRAGCTNVTANVTANVTNSPVVSAGPAQTVCADNPVVTLAGSVTGGSTTGTWTGTGTFSNANQVAGSTYTPTATEVANGTATVTLTSTVNGNCLPVNASMIITIRSAPTINAGNDQTVCGLNPAVSLNAIATDATGGTWSIITGSGTFTNANSLSTTYNAIAADLTRGYVDLRVTSSGSGTCLPVFDDIHISFTPVPSANAGPNQTVCTTDFPVQLAGSGSTGSWTSASGNAAGFSNASALNSTYTPSASEVAATTATLTYATTPSAFCPSVQSQMTITIVPGPAVSAGTPATICGNVTTINLAGTVTGPSTTGGFWSTANGTGSIANPNALSTTYTISPADITRGTVTFDLASVGNAQCNVVHATVTYTILAPITVSAGADQNICGLGGISLNGTSSTGSGTWTIVSGTGSFNNANALNAVFTPTIAVPGAVTLRLTTTGNGTCPAQQADVTYTISPAPTVSAGPNQTICADSAYVQLAGSFTVSSGIRWTKVVGTGTFAPDSVSANSRYTPSAADRSSGTVTLRATTTGNGICAAVFADMTITITPRVTISAGADQTKCANNAVATITGTVSGGSSTGTWTSSSGNAAGFANANALSTTYTPSATDISNAIVTLTFRSTANGNCKAASSTMVIHYTPAPVVNAGSALTACASTISSGGVALNGSVTGGSTTGIWSSPTGGSFSPNNTTLNAHYIPSAADTTAKTVTLTLTSTGNGTCNAVSQTVVLTFSPIPVVEAGPNVTICADSFYVALNGMVANAGGGIWSTTAGAGTFLPSTINLNANFTPSAAARTAHVAVLTLTSTSNGACAAVSDNKIVTITDAPTVDAGPDITVCANDSIANITGASFTVASGVQWISNGSQSFSAPTSTTTNYIPTSLDVSSSPLTLTIRTTGNGMCKPATDQMTLTITPSPVVSAGPNRTVCADIAGVQLNGSVTAGSTTGTWTTPTTGGTFSPNANTLNAVYNLAPADITSGSVVLTLTSTSNGLCKPVASTMTINVTPAPTVNAGSNQTICADGTATLNGSFTVASGIQWSTAGSGTFTPSAFVTNPVYNPSNADTTAHSVVLTLTTTGNGTCNPVHQDITLTINPAPIVEAGLNRVVCADVDQLVLSGAYVLHATGGTWTTNGTGTFSPDANTINAIYSPSAADISSGNITLSLAATGAGTCGPVSDNLTVRFTPVATVSAGPDISVCNDVTSININASATNATVFDWVKLAPDNNPVGTPSPTTLSINYAPTAADKTAGSVTLRITASPGGGCANVEDDMTITFVTAPPIDAGADITVCDSELPIQLNATGTTAQWDPSPTGGTFLPNNQTLNAIYVPSAAEIAAHSTVTLTIRTINNGVCAAGVSTVDVTINPGPTVTAGPDQTICRNVPTVTLAGSKTLATGVTWTRVSSSGTFNNNTLDNAVYTPSAADYSAGVATLVITTTGNAGCNPVSDTMKVFITPEPTLSLGPNLTRCGDAGTVQLNATSTNAASINWSNVTGSGSFSNNSINNPVYTINGADPVPGTLTVQAVITPSAASGTCNNVTRTVNIALTAIPTVTAGPGPVTRCTTTPNVVLSGSSITTATGGIWTSNGTGTFSPNNTALHPTYVPSSADLLLPSVILTLTTTGNGQCQTYSSPITVNFDRQPTVTAAPDRTVICSGNVVNFTSSFTNATGVFWTKNGADGTFDNNTSTTPVFTPGPNDINNGGMIITVTTTGTTTCNQAVRNIAIGIVPSPVATVNAGFDQIICADADTVQLNGFIAIALGGQWTVSTNRGLFLPNDNDLSAKYLPDPIDKVAGNTIVITLSSTGNGICAPTTDDMNLSFTPIPTIDAGADMIVCADTAYLEFNPTFTTATGVSWSTLNGTGTFAPGNTTTNAHYFLTPADINAGVIGFTAATTGNGTCKTYEDAVEVKITPKPTLSLGPDRIVCAGASTVSLNASTTIATSAVWSTSGAGTFSPNPNLATSYSIMSADTTAKSINVFAQSANQGNCKAVYDTLQINFQSRPISVAGPAISSCANVPSVTLNNAAIYNATGGRWTSSGNGNFSSANNQLNNVYTPSPTDRANGSVTLTLTSTGNGQCPATFSQLVVSIAPTPVVTANPAILCDPALGAPLSGTVTNAGGGIWSSSSSGGTFSPSPTLLSATYFPSAAETAIGQAVLTLTSTGNGSCIPETASIQIVIEPLPVSDAGPDQFICTNGVIDLNAVTIQPSINYTWTVSGGAVIATTPNTQTNVPANTGYVLTATDAKGCFVRDTMDAFVFTMPAFNITPNPLCFEENLVIQSNPTPMPVVGGTYQWYRDGVILSGENNVFTNPPVPGTYSILYNYASCNAQASGVLNRPPQLTTEDITACNNDNTALLATSNIANVTYSWTFNGAPAGGNTNTINIVVPSDTSVYYVTATDNVTACPTTDSIYVLGIPRPIIPLINDTICIGTTVRLTARPTNIAALDQYQKTTFNWLQDGNPIAVTDSIYFASATGVYTAGVNIDRCGATQNDTIFVAPFPSSNLPDNTKFCDESGNSVTLDAGLADNYEWQTGNVADTLQTLTVRPADDRYYAVKIGNRFGCQIEDSIFVKNICAPRIYIPNAFTPGLANPDQIFTVFGKHFYNYKMVVFNRWGEAIFETTDKNVGWDGKYKGEDMPTGVYPVIITYEGREEFRGQQKYVGQVTLIR